MTSWSPEHVKNAKIEVVQKIWIIAKSLLERLLMMLAYSSAHVEIILQLLSFKQKQRRMDIAQEMLTTFNDDPDLFKKVITGTKH